GRGNLGSPSSCVPAAHSRECIGMNWHTRRAEVVAQASFSCCCASIHLLAPYDTCVQRHRILRARTARPYGNRTITLRHSKSARSAQRPFLGALFFFALCGKFLLTGP